MRELLARLIINTVALYGAGQLITGIHVESWGMALWGAIIFSLLNMIVKPILKIISFPITCFGLFSLVINAFILYLTAFLSSIQIDSFGTALVGGIAVGIINWFLGILFLKENK